MDFTRDREWASAEVLVDHCTIYGDDAGADPVFDEDLGHVVYPADDVVWQGDCAVSANLGLAAGMTIVSDDPQAVSTHVVRVPLDALGLKVGQVVVIDALHAGGDKELLGLHLTIDSVGMRSHAVVRRLRCTERQSVAPA
jgi:uncharacterized protein DUF6093